MLKFNNTKKVVIPGIAPRDLSDDDIKLIAMVEGVTPAQVKKNLTATGLYSEVPKTKGKK